MASYLRISRLRTKLMQIQNNETVIHHLNCIEKLCYFLLSLIQQMFEHHGKIWAVTMSSAYISAVNTITGTYANSHMHACAYALAPKHKTVWRMNCHTFGSITPECINHWLNRKASVNLILHYITLLKMSRSTWTLCTEEISKFHLFPKRFLLSRRTGLL